MSTNNVPFPNHIVLNLISNLKGDALLNMMNLFEQIHHLVENNMKFLIEQFISKRPYEETLWEFYNPITIEQFKINLQVQEFVSSGQLEKVIEKLNSENPTHPKGTREPYQYGKEMNDLRKLLFGMLYYHKTYLRSKGEVETNLFDRVSINLYSFDEYDNECIKFFIKVITYSPTMGNIVECEEGITYFREMNQHDEFFAYVQEMTPIARANNILLTFTCFKPNQIKLFKKYCKLGIKSNHAQELIDDKITMTKKRKKIYFELLNKVDSITLLECVYENEMRDLTVNPLNSEEQKSLDFELQWDNID